MFVYIFKTAPFLRIVIPFIVGILWQYQKPLPLFPVICVVGILLVIHVLVGYLPLWWRFKLDPYRGILLQLVIFCTGCMLVNARTRICHPVQQPIMTGIIAMPVLPSQYGSRTTVTLPGKVQLLVYFPPDSNVVLMKEGDKLLFNGVLQPVSYSGNPGSFNYRAYCADRHIYHQVHLQKGHYKAIPMAPGFLLRCRNSCLKIIDTYIGGREAGLAAALLIGYRYGLDKEMVNDYMQTGIVHIIAISGMHLALIYGSLLWCLQWLPAQRFYSILKGILIIILLWGFTLLTGASASVLRAAVMFTVVTIGKFFLDRESSTYNQLALSAFLLLCYDPAFIRDIGFQLSYLAVLGIMICNKRLYKVLSFKRTWLRKIWEASALAIAAQAVTFPLCLYHFGQFPLYFLPANLLAVPLSTVILYAEMVLMCVQTHWLGACLQWLMMVMNMVIAWIGHLPGALILGLHISVYGMMALYVCLGGMLAGRKGIPVIIGAICLWSLSALPVRLQRQRQQLMVVYNQSRHTGVDFIRGHVAQFAGDDSIATDMVQAARAFYAADTGRLCGFEQVGHFICCGNRRLVIVDSALPASGTTKKFRTDYLLLSHNPRVAIKDLDRFFEVGCYIFDASSSRSRIQEWKSECKALTLRFFSVPDQGPYVVNF
jgi:competence protein ComEC